MDRHADEVNELIEAVTASDGELDGSIRRAIFEGEGIPGPLGGFVDKVREESYRITDSDISEMIATGISQDSILEATLAAAVGAAHRRLAAGLRALGNHD